MIDHRKVFHLAGEALKYWETGQAEKAVPLYQEVLQLAGPDNYLLPFYHHQLAGALSALERFAEAREHYQIALALELKEGKGEFDPGVMIARYWLAQHFLEQEEPLQALETVEPSLKDGVRMEWLLRSRKTLALHALGRFEEARAEADLTLMKAPSDEKRKELTELFAERMPME